MILSRLSSFLFVFLLTYTSAVLGTDDDRIDFFESRIRPVLIEHCYRCHSTEAGESKGSLLLDSREGLLVGGDSGPAILPEEPESSLLWLAINHSGEASEMPPDSRLSNEVVEDFRKWIAAGAVDPREGHAPAAKQEIDFEDARKFWSFQPLRKSFAQDSIDDFLESGVEVAEPDKLVRRLFLDLIGLPPTPQERLKFIELYNASSPSDAVAVFTDDLLSRRAFGEKWARHWMDLARYADSNGGDFNLTFPEAWRYRNYLIDAFNNDMPYDQFLQEQIAGDLLPADTVEQQNRQLIATGFLMVAPKMLTERNKPKMHLDIADEQLDTIGRALLGMTLGCARCHDHKFDPIPTTDYYAMLGILHSTRTADGILMGNVNVSGWKETDLTLSLEEQALLEDLKAQIQKIDSQLSQRKAELEELQRKGAIVVDDTEATKSGPWRSSTYRPNRVGEHYLATDKGKALASITWKTQLPSPGKYEVRVSFGGGSSLATNATYLVRSGETEHKVVFDQSTKPKVNNLWSPLGVFEFTTQGEGAANQDSAAVVAEVHLSDHQANGHVIADAVQFVPVTDASKGLDAELANKTQQNISVLTAEIKALEEQQQGLEAKLPAIGKAMAAKDHQDERLGDLRVRIRGETKNLGESVPRGFLRVVSMKPTDVQIPEQQSGRVQLAEWITRADHPLTARVMTNRIWQQLFGRGIVATADNFGTRGAKPTHPELLDFLAMDFVKEHWSIKSAIRKIVTSKAYQRTAQAGSPGDPNNEQLLHQNCRPVSAEALRDSMLAIAGVLDTEFKGSAVDSFGMYAVTTNGKSDPSLAKTGELRQRSIYMPLVRGALPPSLAVFDLPNPDLVTGTRSITTVPSQALFMLNSPFVKDLSLLVAKRVSSSTESLEDAARKLYPLVLIREADAEEVALATAYIQNIRDQGSSELEALSSFVQILFSSTEFRFVE